MLLTPLTMSVSSQPDVILGYEELQANPSEPREEAGVARAQEPVQVAQQHKAHDLQEQDRITNYVQVTW